MKKPRVFKKSWMRWNPWVCRGETATSGHTVEACGATPEEAYKHWWECAKKYLPENYTREQA